MLNFRKIGFVFGLGILAMLGGCLGGSSGDAVPVTPAAGIGFIHSAPSSPNLDVVLDSKTINNSSFTYSTFSGYLAIAPGTHTIRFNSAKDQTAQLDTTLTAAANKSYSLFLYNKGTKMKSILTFDGGAAFATASGMMVRVVHLSPDVPEVKVLLVGETKSLSDQLGFTDLTQFSEYNARTTTVEVRSLADGHVIATQSFDPVPHQFFTIALMGYATPPAGNLNTLTLKVINN